MDAYCLFDSSSTRRDSSRLDQDLKTIRRYSLPAPDGPSDKARSPTNHQRPPHIGVVGAGIAGLRCADILLQHGFRVTVLEGRHRLGGRLHQARLVRTTDSGGDESKENSDDSPLVDMGPNWIHGTKDNPILDLVRATDTLACSYDVDATDGSELAGAVFASDGALLPYAAGKALATVMWTIVEEAFVHSNQHCGAIDPAASLHDFFLQRLPAHVPDTVPGYAEQRARVLQMADFWGAFVGSPITRQSLKYFWLEECIEGENLFCAGTYKKVLDRLVEPVVRGAAVHYGQVVTRIASEERRDRDDHANGSGGSNDDTTTTQAGVVTMTTACGDVFAFDEVVCTAPLGWLQRHLDAFAPPLPPRLAQAVTSIGYGALEKVYIAFSAPFWQGPPVAAATGGTDDHTAARDPEARGVRGFCQWLAPGVYAQPSNPQHWSQEAVDLSALPPAAAHPTLLFYLFGDQSQHVTDTLAALAGGGGGGRPSAHPDEPPNPKQAAFLVDYFRPYYARLPHYDAADPRCQPTGCLASNWRHDPLAGHGSYSNFQVGLAAGDEDVRVMRVGVPSRGLWLAGEHTAPFVALGTATGAYWSGESVGRRLADAYGRSKVGAADAAADATADATAADPQPQACHGD
ncbi:Amine oxidase [Niveomyces insectorum RCEF 264]|uniref:Amine oxidase n=1 Tax=Niveomyces insectorum RCEF 264 TaxID=1081102 RepID=A0A167S102_9HYPO|nr:Amine oxidase [Niveomyces insectorum RCEF 264]